MVLIRLFAEFFKIGIVTFGGGQAMLPLLQRTFVTELHWITQERFLYFISIAEVTPGPVALNMATFIGYEIHGVIGSLFATLGVVMPSFLIIFLIANFESRFKKNVLYKRFMLGVKPVIPALLINAIYLIVRRGFTGVTPYIIATLSLVVFIFYKKSPVIILLATGILGIFALK
ncbi:MAG: chromate transporter [bacterium]|nr:chromate transporter [bacterium]